jgi:hypothetical protein
LVIPSLGQSVLSPSTGEPKQAAEKNDWSPTLGQLLKMPSESKSQQFTIGIFSASRREIKVKTKRVVR